MENFFLCYECGATFNARSNFDEHVFVHQAVSLCYQLYEFEKGGPPAKAKEESQHVSTGAENAGKPQPSRLQAQRKASSDLPRKYTRKTSAPKRKLTDVSISSDSKAPAMKQRKILQSETKTVKTSKSQEALTDLARISDFLHGNKISRTEANESKSIERISSAAIPPMKHDQHPLASTSSTPAADQITDLPIATIPITTATAITPAATIPTTAQPALPTTASTTQAGAVTAGASQAALPKCPNCEYRSCHGTDMIEHVVRVHKTAITSLERTDFVDGKWSEIVKLEPQEQCAFCDRPFEEVTEYFLHVIICHKSNLLSPGVSKYHCIVHLTDQTMAAQTVHIYMKRPEPLPES